MESALFHCILHDMLVIQLIFTVRVGVTIFNLNVQDWFSHFQSVLLLVIENWNLLSYYLN